MRSSSLQLRADRFSDRKGGYLNRPAAQTILRDTMRGIKMKQINVSTPTYPNLFAIIDNVDVQDVEKFKWTAVKFQRSATFYAQRQKGRHKVMMHREILKLNPKQKTDHIDGDGLNNQRQNLRKCTHAQNMQNRRMPKNNKSGFKGVHWCKRERKWAAMIGVGGKHKTLGYFFCLIKAAKKYDTAAIKYYGEFANTNFRSKK